MGQLHDQNDHSDRVTSWPIAGARTILGMRLADSMENQLSCFGSGEAHSAEANARACPLLAARRSGVDLGRGKSKSHVVRNSSSSAVAQLRFEYGADPL